MILDYPNKIMQIAIKNKEIDLISFTNNEMQYYYQNKASRYRNYKELSKDKSWNHPIFSIDLHWINDQHLVEDMVEFLSEKLLDENLNTQYRHLTYACVAASLSELNLSGEIDEFDEFCNNPVVKHRIKGTEIFCRAFILFVDRKRHPLLFDRNYWKVAEYNLARDRFNPSTPVKYLIFKEIRSEDTKYYIKKFVEYCLVITGISVSTIEGRLRIIIRSCNIINKSPIEWNRDDALRVLEFLHTFSNERAYNDNVSTFMMFFDYLVVNDFVKQNLFNFQDTIKNIKKKYIRNSVDKITINQIFNCLNKFRDSNLALMFLVLYCTGMRVSEVCQIKRRCLEKIDKGFFINFYSQKMKKDVSNVIPEKLYQMLELKILSITNDKQQYLFEAPNGGAYRRATLIKKINDEFQPFNIKTPDGTPYVFRPHAYRHTMGKKMREMEIAFQYIQEQLHHASPDMTMNYVEFMDKEKVQKMSNFFDVNGNIAPVVIDLNLNDEEAYAEYMRKYINAQMLPNGVCARPIKLGNCPHCNSCLTCLDFRTTVNELQIHKEHLKRVEQYLIIAKENNWIPQIATNEEIKKNLLAIIHKLEEAERNTKHE